MTTKRCSYKGCGAFTNSSHQASETFYSFPKHQERLKIWMQLGGCPNEQEIPYASRYFCSKHFDETKYVASNPRRKQLLSAAVPYPCMESSDENVVTITDENDIQCVVSSGHGIDEDHESNEVNLHDDEISEHVSNEINCISDSIETFENYQHYQNEINCTNDFEEPIVVEGRLLKRKFDHSFINEESNNLHMGPSKRTITIISNRPTSTINVVQNQQTEHKTFNDDLDMMNTQDDPNITTFIFKGEEYIQMPKEQYHREKMALISKMKRYEEILKTCKSLIDTVKI